jgi:hypothetical protein
LIAVVSDEPTEFVFALTTAATELDAVETSDAVARDPELRPAPVSVRVPFTHTSAARVPNVVRLRVPFAQTAAGIPVTDAATEAIEDPSEEEAVFSEVFVFALTATVPAETAAPSDELAVPIAVFVFAFTLAVPALTAAPNELEALVTSDWSASEPELRPAPVSVRVA